MRYLPRRGRVRPGTRCILGLRLRDRPVRLVSRRTLESYEVVHPDVDPSDQIFLRDILPIEELVKVDRRRAGQVEVPDAARRRLCFLATRNSKVVSRPVGVVEHALGTHDGLRCTVNVCPKK